MSTQESSKTQGTTASTRPVPAAKKRGRRAAAPPPPTSPLNALVLLHALRRRWLAAIVLGVLAAGAVGAAVWFFLPPAPYAASAKFRIETHPEGTLYDHPEARTEFSNYEQMQVALLKGQMVLNAALTQPKVAQLPEVRKAIDPVDWLEKQIHIDFPNGQEIVHLTISSDDKETCKILVDAVSAAYLQEVSSTAAKHRQDRRQELTDLVDKLQRDVKAMKADIRKRAEPVGAQDPQVLILKQRLAADKAMQAQHEITEADSRLRKLKNEQSLLPKADDPVSVVIPARQVDAVVDRSPDIVKLLSAKDDLEAQIEAGSKTAVGGMNHPEVQKLTAKLDALKVDLESRRKGLRADCEARLREDAVAASAVRAARLADDIAAEEALEKRLQSDIERYDAESRDINKAAADLEDLKSKKDEAESAANQASVELQKLSVEKDDPSRVSLWEETTVTRPDEVARKVQTAGMAGSGAFLTVLLLVALVEFRSRRVQTPQEMVQKLGLTLVGTVPAHPRGRPGTGGEVWKNHLTESIDAARTLLMHGNPARSLRVVLITSAVGGEGKTSLASHLAVSLARSGRKTLLIDGDLRNPAIHRLFNLPVGPGFSELIRGEVQASEVLRPTPVPDLQVMCAGQFNPTTLSLLSQAGVGDLFSGLKGLFDVIVVDSSPVLPVADPLQLARHVDGVLLSVLQDVSMLPAVHDARQRLTAVGAVILGAVVSGTRPSAAYYYGQHYLKQSAVAK